MFRRFRHIAVLSLVRELQGHGFTLSAIEKYVEQIPATATPSDIARHLSLLQLDLPATAH